MKTSPNQMAAYNLGAALSSFQAIREYGESLFFREPLIHDQMLDLILMKEELITSYEELNFTSPKIEATTRVLAS